MNDDSFLTETLSRAVADVHTPFDAITGSSLAAGRRIKRRRTAGAAVAGVACVAAVTAVAVGGSHLLAGGQPDAQPFAGGSDSPSASTSPPSSPPSSAPSSTPSRPAGEVPVALRLPGWSCEEFPTDEKMWCSGPGDLAVSVVWRAAATYDGFVAKYDGKRSTTPMLDGTGTVVAARDQVAVIVSEPKGRWFVSVQPGAGVDLELGHQIAEHLVWQ
jgi:hypothetical protein